MKYLLLTLISIGLLLHNLYPEEQFDRNINQINEFHPKQKINPQWDQKLIQIERARKYLKDNREIIIAVIDTGLDLKHPLFKNKVWSNPGESGLDNFGQRKESNGIDDDKNGYIDDVSGWNFVSGNDDVFDHHGHGTHVSGIIAQLAPNVKILPLKYFDESSDGAAHMKNTILAIEYARKMGAHIINYSAGGLSQNPAEEGAIERASRQGILFVAAAGNESANTDFIGYYPAGYDLPNIISVTAIDSNSKILPSSNFSESRVDIAAPGDEIYSSLPGNSYGSLTGTSQATAFVSAIAALLMSHRPDMKDPEQIIHYLVSTGSWNKYLNKKVKQASRLNAFYALTMAGSENGKNNSNSLNIVAKQIDDILNKTKRSSLNRAPSGDY